MEENLQKISEILAQPDWTSVIASAGTLIAAIAAAVSAYFAGKASKASLESNNIQKEQILIQNRLTLLEKRVENYLLCRTFFNLVNEEKELDFNFEQKYRINVLIAFEHITNTHYFGEAPKIIEDMDNDIHRREFFEKIEDLENVAERSLLLFGKKHGEILKDFIMSYRGVLICMYNYYSVVYDMDNDRHNKNIEKLYSNTGLQVIDGPKMKTEEELFAEYGEPKVRKELRSLAASLKRVAFEIKKRGTLNSIEKKLIVEGEKLK